MMRSGEKSDSQDQYFKISEFDKKAATGGVRTLFLQKTLTAASVDN